MITIRRSTVGSDSLGKLVQKVLSHNKMKRKSAKLAQMSDILRKKSMKINQNFRSKTKHIGTVWNSLNEEHIEKVNNDKPGKVEKDFDDIDLKEARFSVIF